MNKTTPRGTARRVRRALVAAHRYAGLAIAVFLIVTSITDSAIVFFRELDDCLNASLAYIEPPSQTAAPLPHLALRAQADLQLPAGYSVWELPLAPLPPGRALRLSLNHEGDGAQIYTAAYVNPYSGRLIGLRNQTDFSDPRNLMLLLYALHDTLMLGTLGTWLLGIAALLWTIDCFVGFYLTLPPSGPGHARRGWWTRWTPAWLVRTGSFFSAVSSFHRTAGLWLWPVLFVFAWSSVAFLMPALYQPVMSALFRSEHGESLPALPEPRSDPHLSWPEALKRGEELMAAEARARGFTIAAPALLSHEPEFGFFRYQVSSSLDLGSGGDTTVWMDSDTGRQVDFWAPTGRSSGNTVDSWLTQLHFGTKLRLLYRLFIFVVGIATAGLSATGLLIWLRKRRVRSAKARHQRKAGEEICLCGRAQT
jgi:uncharacterized iron-regulated membrane protein